MDLENVLGELYFKKVSYVMYDYNNKEKVRGLALVCESSVQRGSVYVDVLNEKTGESFKERLNSDVSTFNTKIVLENPSLVLKSDGKYRITSTGFSFFKG